MTKYRFYRQGGEKRDLPLSLSSTIHYAIPFLLYTFFKTLNPFPTSCRESLESIVNPYFLTPNLQFARIRHAPKSLITRSPISLFKGILKRGLTCGEESDLPAHLWQKGFEARAGFHHLASNKGIDLQGNALKPVFVGVSTFSTNAIIKELRR